MDILSLTWNPDGFLTVGMAALVTVIATQWLKRFLPDWKFTPLLALVLAVGTQMAAVALSGSGLWFEAAGVGALGATLAVFGYEAVVNGLAFAGIGPRAE
jgi:hypothetical protein